VAGFRTNDEDEAVGGAVENLDVGLAGGDHGFTNQDGRIETDRHVVGGGLGVNGTANGERSAAECRKDFHGISF
jgi:hypothetical protein